MIGLQPVWRNKWREIRLFANATYILSHIHFLIATTAPSTSPFAISPLPFPPRQPHRRVNAKMQFHGNAFHSYSFRPISSFSSRSIYISSVDRHRLNTKYLQLASSFPSFSRALSLSPSLLPSPPCFSLRERKTVYRFPSWTNFHFSRVRRLFFFNDFVSPTRSFSGVHDLQSNLRRAWLSVSYDSSRLAFSVSTTLICSGKSEVWKNWKYNKNRFAAEERNVFSLSVCSWCQLKWWQTVFVLPFPTWWSI